MAIANEKCTSPIIEEPQEHILKGKLRESRRKVGQLVILDMLICPHLLAIIFLTLWIELGYPNLNASGICNILTHFNGPYIVASVILWATAHFADMWLLLSVATGDINYCRLHGSIVAPILEMLILFFFTLIMWSCLTSLPNYSVTKFIIIVGCALTLVLNFYNYLLNVLAEHFQLLTRSKLMKYKIIQAV